MLVAIENVSKSFGSKIIFDKINCTIEEGDRIGLIGKNGCGKTTLLNIICKNGEIDEGQININKNKTIGFLEQNSGLDNSNTIMDEMRSTFSELLGIQKRLEQLNKEISKTTDEDNRGILSEYSRLTTYFEQQDGYNIDYKIRKVLNGLGFYEKDEQTIINTLSGGEKTRLALCKLLLSKPDLLVLDEPTNHLDLKALTWLEEYLNEYKGSVLIVSHDRYFLDKIVNRIWELEFSKLNVFKGNYSKYLVLKEEKIRLLEKEYEIQQNKIASMEEFVNKNIARASTSKMAKSRLKALDNMELIEKPRVDRKRAKLKFEIDKKSGFDVLKVSDLDISVDNGKITLFDGVCLDVKRGEKIAIIGKNGVGKSTFLKTLIGDNFHNKGSIVFGKNVSIGYYDQEHLQLNKDNSVLEELWTRFPKLKEQEVRSYLGNVLITGDDVYKKVGVLSGGERAKLLFAILMVQKPNVLILDEPTNHLDIPSKELIEEGLSSYEGTIITVSHDRYFLNKIPDKICLLDNSGFEIFDCNYDQIIEQIKYEQPVVKEKKQNTTYKSKEEKKQQALRRNEISKLEKQLEEIEGLIFSVEEEMTQETVYNDFKLMQEKCQQLEDLKNKQNEIYEKWIELAD